MRRHWTACAPAALVLVAVLLPAAAAQRAPAAAAAAGALPPAPDQCAPDLIQRVAWGTGSGAFQFEGVGAGRAPTVWDTYIAANPRAIADGSNASLGADLYRRYRQDVALLKSLGVRERGAG